MSLFFFLSDKIKKKKELFVWILIFLLSIKKISESTFINYQLKEELK